MFLAISAIVTDLHEKRSLVVPHVVQHVADKVPGDGDEGVEPGLYVPELGGFRHADTVIITDSGIEVLTYYPRDLVSLTIAL